MEKEAEIKETKQSRFSPKALWSPEVKEQFRTLPDRMKQSFRREEVWGFFASMAVMIIVSLAFFSPDNFDGHIIPAGDSIQGLANGQEAQEYEQETGEKALWTNSLFSGMPTFQIAPAYSSNDLFSWINKVYGLGLPTPSNLMFMMMFGFLIMLTCLRLRWWYALIGSLAWGLSSYFIIIIGAGHIWKFVALTYVPPTIAGLIMIYRGRRLAGAALTALFLMMELNANHPQITYYFGFVMLFLIVGFLIQSIRRKEWKKWGISTAVFVGAAVLAFGANLPSIYNSYAYSKETKRAASELTPLPDPEGKQSTEKPTGGLPKEEIGGWSNLPEESLSLLIPNIKGGASVKPEEGGLGSNSLSKNKHFDQNLESDQIQVPITKNYSVGIYDYFTEYFGGKGGTNGPFYVGVLIVSLFLLGCFIVRGTIKWVLLISTVFSILLAMGNHFEALTDFMIYNVPMYNKFRAAETALVIACLCMPLMGMLALQRLFTTPEPLKNRNILRGLSVAFIFPAFICILAYVSPSIFGAGLTEQEAELLSEYAKHNVYPTPLIENTANNIESMRHSLVSDDALRSLGFLILSASLIILAVKNRLSKGLACLGLGLVITWDLYGVDKRYVNHDIFSQAKMSAQDLIEPDQIDAEILKDQSYYRVADLEGFDNARRSYFHHMIGGYHAAKLNRYNDLLERRLKPGIYKIFEEISNEYQYGIEPHSNDWALISMLNTKYIIVPTQDGSIPYLNKKALGPAWLVDNIKYVENADEEMAALQTLDPSTEAVADKRFKDLLGDQVVAHSQGDYIKLDEYTPNQLTYTVDTKNGGLAVFSEVWFPWGWHATIDGEEVELGRVNYVLRALRVPAGKHTIVMTFDPQSIHTTTAVAYASVTLVYLLCALALFMAIIARKKDDERS